MKELKSKTFSNGTVYALKTDDGFPIEVTDTLVLLVDNFQLSLKKNNKLSLKLEKLR